MHYNGKYVGIWTYRSDDWSGGYKIFRFRIGRLQTTFRWTVWLPKVVR